MAHTAAFSTTPPHSADLGARLRRLDMLSRLLDTAFVLPGTTIRFGIDGIVGLVPIVGDWIGVLLSCYVLIEAFRIGVPASLLGRMALNVAIEGGIGAVPIAGDIFDVFWRANRRSYALLREHLRQEGRI